TNSITHQNFGDLLGNLDHNHQFAVLNNHSFGNGNLSQTFIYDDSDQHDIPNAQHTDGPGTLINFLGEQGAGVWRLTESDNALGNTGRVDSLWIRLDPQTGGGATNTVSINAGSYAYFAIDIPPEATNLLVNMVNISSPVGEIDMLLKLGALPVKGNADY